MSRAAVLHETDGGGAERICSPGGVIREAVAEQAARDLAIANVEKSGVERPKHEPQSSRALRCEAGRLHLCLADYRTADTACRFDAVPEHAVQWYHNRDCRRRGRFADNQGLVRRRERN